MLVREKQYITNDLTDWQERIIFINDWDEYTKQFYSNTSYSNTLTLPRVRKIKSVSKTDKTIKVEFYHDLIDRTIVHESEIVSDDNKIGVIKEYDNFPKRIDKIVCSERFNYKYDKEEFKREYECVFCGKEKTI